MTDGLLAVFSTVLQFGYGKTINAGYHQYLNHCLLDVRIHLAIAPSHQFQDYGYLRT